MMQLQQENVLCRIAASFDEQSIIWALGGPMLLCNEGILEECDIIDILLMPQDIKKADALLSSLGEKHPRVPAPAYVSQFFHTYTIDGVFVNLVSGMTLHYKGFLFRYPFDKSAIVSMQPMQGLYIPCTAPEDWWVLYQMMPDRADRYAAVDKYLSSRGLRYPERFDKLRRQPLPPAILAGIYRLSSLAPKQILA